MGLAMGSLLSQRLFQRRRFGRDSLAVFAGMIATSKLPASIASRYTPIRLIGQGGMGAVYEVEHTRTGDRLALKVLLSSVGASPEALERFKREARASARIKSEYVVRVTDADVAPELDGAPFLVMELLQGMDLERAALMKPPTAAEVVGWLAQVALAIDKAHRLGIVHRDLKPENLFLATYDDRPAIVKVLDFGIAKMAQEGTAATNSGQLLGTPKYMAPEQAAANPRITPATDLYAMGLIAYRLIVGESYYQGDNVVGILGELIHGHMKAPSERNDKMSAAFDAWFMKACARDPEARFGSAAEQVEALAQALALPALTIARPSELASDSGPRPGVASAPTTPLTPDTLTAAVRSNPPKPRRMVPAVTAAVGLALVVATIVVLAGRTGSQKSAPGSSTGAAATATNAGQRSNVAPAPAPAPSVPSIPAAPAGAPELPSPPAPAAPPPGPDATGAKQAGPSAGTPRGTAKTRPPSAHPLRQVKKASTLSNDDPFSDQK